MHNNLYVFTDVDEAAYHPQIGALPWPVTLLLATRSKKHIMLDALKPNSKVYNQAFLKAEQQLMRRGSVGKYVPEWWKKAWGNSKPSNFMGSVAPDLRAFAGEVRAKLAEAVRTAVNSRRPVCTTRPRFEIFGFEWLIENDISAIQTDKDGGFCLVNKQLVCQLHENVMKRPMYEEIGPWSVLALDVLRGMCRLLKRAEQTLEIDGFASHYINTIRNSNSDRLVSKTLCTTKTHTEAGKVALRVIHSGSGHPFGGISKFIADFVRARLANACTICSSTDQVIDMINNLVIPIESRETLRFVKLDVKEFYMMGTPEQLVSNAFEHIAQIEKRTMLEDLVRYILSCTVRFLHSNWEVLCC